MNLTDNTFSWYQVPKDIKSLLLLAAENWENTCESEQYINQALSQAGDNTDVLIGAYRYFFYKKNYPMALKIAEKVLEKVKRLEKLPDDWQQLKPILSSRKDDPNIRLYLSTCVASGFVLARLGELEKARELTQRVKEISDTSEFSASTINDILTRPADDEDED
ncbi:MAG: hypothetical protein F6J89_14945 [Symploca sp. SIO1C4]|uniref:Tetratricopeptide repeat protein n=1 Tax=Symploca sp. SIO1C4 TaxID=2607765 RepID=A0A6B3NGY2_9CYAN|nr:hypothetical protein [Symploca sp. SIO1C4]